jgi:GNAT superfamily N-acetyltransferase
MTATDPRPARPEDAPEIARLAGALGYQASGAQMRVRLLRLCPDPTQFVYVASAGAGPLLGWIHAGRRLALESGEAVEILGLVVDPAARRRAVGRARVEAAARGACDCGLERIVVRSNAARMEAHVFYPALGYVLAKSQHVYAKSVAMTGAAPTR